MVVLAGILSSGCDPGDVSLTEAADVGGSGTALDVTVVLAAGEPGPVEWSTGIPGATVYYGRTSSRGWPWLTAHADSAGHVTIPRIEQGLYRIAAEAESAEGGSVYGGGIKVRVVGDGTTEAPLPVYTSRPAGLVISEVYTNEPPPWVYENVGESKYVEVYNNSQATIDLDELLIGHFYRYNTDTGLYNHHRCEDTEPLRNDPQGVWAALIWRFPGSGGQHPLPPGETALLAVSAADHRSAHESFLDLSGADFEFLLPGLADNPAVPNMEVVGTRPPREQDFRLDQPWFIADAQDVSLFPRVRDPGGDPANPFTDYFVRIPAETLHDVAFLEWDAYGQYSTLPPLPLCVEPVYADFDRLPAGKVETEATLHQSIQRRVLGDRLMDTNVSRIDFRMASRTPGRVD